MREVYSAAGRTGRLPARSAEPSTPIRSPGSLVSWIVLSDLNTEASKGNRHASIHRGGVVFDARG